MAAFGWAINQLKMGRTVRRDSWPTNIVHIENVNDSLSQLNSMNQSFAYFINHEDLFAEDWGAGLIQEATKPPNQDAVF